MSGEPSFGQRTQTCSRRAVLIVFQQSAQPLSASNLRLLPDHRSAWGRKEQQVVFTLMIPFLMIVHLVMVQRTLERTLPKQDQFGEAFFLDRPDPPFRIGIQVRTLGWQSQSLYLFRFDQLAK